jgi:hypothetical protein
MMCTRINDKADGILDPSKGRLQAAQTEWSHLTMSDFSHIANKQDLITTVKERYKRSHAAAVQDVELWNTRVQGRETRARCDAPTRPLK